jgi:hypothetical protein
MDNQMKTRTALVLYGTNSHLLETLRQLSTELSYIEYEPGFGPNVVSKANLDALWATPMAAVELFGATPPFPLHEACVLKTPPAQIQRGMPPHVIVGVATAEEDPTNSEFSLRLVLSAALRAVCKFNAEHEEQIRRVGILPEDLGLTQLDDPRDAIRIIRQVYDDEVTSRSGS